VGPASHWEGGLNFNPENQYLQIAIEFGIIGFLARMFMYVRFHYIGYTRLRLRWKEKNISLEDRYLIAFSIGMLGLSIS
jgi:O-antigen ligase